MCVQFFTDFIGGEDVWNGLINPKGVNCKGNSCLNELSWASDGAPLTNRYSGMHMNERLISTVVNLKISQDRKSWVEYKFICQFSCSPGRGKWLPLYMTFQIPAWQQMAVAPS